MRMHRFVKSILVLLLLPAGALAQEKVIPAINEVEPWQQVGQQPYEFTWTQREQDPHTLVDFEDMRGWTLELYDGAQGELRRSREQQMWGEYVAKIVYSGVRPESPFPFPAGLIRSICGATGIAGSGCPIPPRRPRMSRF
jgi:hypothetical protein